MFRTLIQIAINVLSGHREHTKVSLPLTNNQYCFALVVYYCTTYSTYRYCVQWVLNVLVLPYFLGTYLVYMYAYIYCMHSTHSAACPYLLFYTFMAFENSAHKPIAQLTKWLLMLNMSSEFEDFLGRISHIPHVFSHIFTQLLEWEDILRCLDLNKNIRSIIANNLFVPGTKVTK